MRAGAGRGRAPAVDLTPAGVSCLFIVCDGGNEEGAGLRGRRCSRQGQGASCWHGLLAVNLTP